MKKILSLLIAIGFYTITSSQGLAINTDGSQPDASALLDVKNTSKGVLLPRMSSVQRIAITSPAEGLTVYDTDTKTFWYWSSSWIQIIPNPQTGFHARVSAALLSIPNATNTLLTSYNETFDDGNNFNPATGEFIAPATGLYHIDAKVTFMTTPSVTNGHVSIRLTINGSFTADVMSGRININGSFPDAIAYSNNLKLNSGDRVMLNIFQSFGAAHEIIGGGSSSVTFFSGFRVY